jgi:phospholipase D-like protein
VESAAKGHGLTGLWVAASVALVAVWAFTVADILRRGFDRRRLLAWILIVILLPFLGALLYWVLRRREVVGSP